MPLQEMTSEVLALSAVEQAALVRHGELSARELVEVSLERIERLNPTLGAFVHLCPERALAEADAIRPGDPRPLCGVPIGLKDLLSATDGLPTSEGTAALGDWVADHDSAHVRRLRETGAIILGKTNTPELGLRPVTENTRFGPTRNPWDDRLSPGGSSGGSAAAVAARMVGPADRSDRGGSIRIPASCCGLVGLKPSRGRVSSGPLLGEDWAGLATTGVIARTVADAALGLDAMAGHLPGDPYWAEVAEPFLPAAQRKPEPMRIGWTLDAPAAVDPEVASAVESLARELGRLGHQTRQVRPDLTRFRALIQVLAVTAVGALPIQRTELLDPLNRLMFEVAPSTSSVEYLKTLTQLHRHARELIAGWDDMDVLLTPTLTEPAPRLGTLGKNVETASDEFLDWLSFTHPFNCTGQPAISLPLARTKSGLPIGIQLVGRPRDEYSILSLGLQLEAPVGFWPSVPREIPSPVSEEGQGRGLAHAR